MRLPPPLYRFLDRCRSGATRILGLREDGPCSMTSDAQVRRLVRELATMAAETWNEHLSHRQVVEVDALEGVVSDFLDVYQRRPLTDNRGGSGFHNCFWLFTVVRLLNPPLIVESGVWRGQTSWLLSTAAPGSSIHSFDLDLRKLAVRSPGVEYYEMDWAAYDFDRSDAKEGICFFDCHVNQALRIREAYDRGFRFLLFDDNPPAHRLAGYGAPGLPTVDMVAGAGSRLERGDVIEWVWKGQKRRYVYDPEDERGARELIRSYAVFPDVGRGMGSGSYSFLSLVELIN